MTIAVIWQEDEAVWAVADTRFSTLGTITEAQSITDHGPKIFPISVNVRQPSSFDIRLQTSIGYTYAGTLGPALATHALCAAALQNLIPINGQDPSLSEIAAFVRLVAERYMRDWAQRWPSNWHFTAFVFGWCHINCHLEAFQLIPSVTTKVEVESRWIDLSVPAAIGTGVVEFEQRMQRLRAFGEDPFGRTAR